MSDTIVDPPPPPTVPDVELAGRVPSHSRARLWVIAAVTSLIVLIAGAALLFYFRVWRYEATARHHVPSNANVAIRLELADLVLFAPVRKHLWPLVEPEKGAAPSPGKPGKSFGDRLKEHTGVSLKTDVREVIIASLDASAWIAIVGGRIPKGRFVKGFEEVAREEGWSGWRREGDILAGPTVSIAQAEDGTVLVGNNRSILAAALPASEESARLAMPDRAPIAFALTSEAWSGVSGQLAGVPHGWILGKVDRASGKMTLGDKPQLEARIQPSPGADATALSSDLDAVLQELRVLTLLAPDVAGEKSALGGATVAAEGGVVVLRAPWPLEGLDRGCERLARLLR